MHIYSTTREARAELSAIIDAALAGEVSVIERGGAPVAKVVGLNSRDHVEWRRQKAAERGEDGDR